MKNISNNKYMTTQKHKKRALTILVLRISRQSATSHFNLALGHAYITLMVKQFEAQYQS